MQKLLRFQFAEWRTRFLEWLQATRKAGRFPDLLRAHDRDSDGCLTRAEFIEAIMSTSRLSSRTLLFALLLSIAHLCLYHSSRQPAYRRTFALGSPG